MTEEEKTFDDACKQAVQQLKSRFDDFDLQVMYGKLLMKPIETLSLQERINYHLLNTYNESKMTGNPPTVETLNTLRTILGLEPK